MDGSTTLTMLTETSDMNIAASKTPRSRHRAPADNSPGSWDASGLLGDIGATFHTVFGRRSATVLNRSAPPDHKIFPDEELSAWVELIFAVDLQQSFDGEYSQLDDLVE